MSSPTLRRSFSRWSAGSEQNPAHRAGHHELQWRHDRGWQKTFRHGLQEHGLQVSSTRTPATTEAHEDDRTTRGGGSNIWLDTIHALYRCWRARKPACAEQNDRTSATSERLLLDYHSSCRCSCTKDWYSALHASTSPLWCSTSPKAHPAACWTAAKERRQLHQSQLQGRSSADPVLILISKQRSTEH